MVKIKGEDIPNGAAVALGCAGGMIAAGILMGQKTKSQKVMKTGVMSVLGLGMTTGIILFIQEMRNK